MVNKYTNGQLASAPTQNVMMITRNIYENVNSWWCADSLTEFHDLCLGPNTKRPADNDFVISLYIKGIGLIVKDENPVTYSDLLANLGLNKPTKKETYYRTMAQQAINAYMDGNTMSHDEMLDDLHMSDEDFSNVMGYSLKEDDEV